jgi:1-acyl-sn-glycerol-3-phosphate acyltransferase
VPASGSLLVVPNHDSQWDPIVIGIALRRRRMLRFLARADLWRIPGLKPVLNGLRQIPIERGAGDVRALEHAVAALSAGQAVCLFPEGRLSRGERLPARSGVGRLAAARPGVQVVLCAVEGTVGYVRFPRRPRVTVTFFQPSGGQPRAGEDPAAMAARFLEEIRERVPPVPVGHRIKQSGFA